MSPLAYYKFVILRWKQIKILKKTTWFGVSSSQGTQNTETATQRCFTEMKVWQKPFEKSSLSGNMVKILEKTHLKYLVFGSFLAVCLHVYSRANSCTTVFSCFSTVTEQLKFLKLLQVVDSASVIFVRRCSSNVIQPISRELQSQWWTPMPKCNFNKVALQLYWNCTSAWLFSYKFPAYFKNPFS